MGDDGRTCVREFALFARVKKSSTTAFQRDFEEQVNLDNPPSLSGLSKHGGKAGLSTKRIRTGSHLREDLVVRLIGVLFFIIAWFGPAVGWAGEPAKRPPNVVIVFVDDLGYGDLGCFGSKIPTPNIDRMAREGVRFTDFYVAQAVCSASRAALMTGCYPNRVGILGALGPASKIGISDRETTIAQMLKKRGYATAIFGKWHLGYQPQFLPTRHGFDEYFGLPYSNDMWPKHPTAKYPDLPLIEGEKTVELNPDQSMLTTRYTERAVQFIEKSKNRPFFLYVPHTMPHVPLFVSDKFKGKSGQGLYGDVVMELDWSVGEILSALKKNGIDEQTLVLFSSDNGPWLSYGNHGGSGGPLREGKGTTWEGGVREPCVMRWPGKIPPGTVCREVTATFDVLPTLAHLCGADLPELPIDGKDISSLMLNEAGAKSPHDAFLYYWDRHLQAIRSGQWKLHLPHAFNTMIGQALGSDGKPGKYVRNETGLALFDLENDVGETKDVAKEHPDVVERLQALAENARVELGDSATKREGKGVRPPGMIK
jgi:arylsulfatase A